jgi:integrating conjugative element protein (TIGR03759 family)
MRVPRLVIAGLVACATFVQVSATAAQTAIEPMAALESRTTQTRVESSTANLLKARHARDWGLRPDEWVRYRRLMQGPLGILSPHLDPLTALGIEARSDAERDYYAALEVRMEGERVAKLLAYQRAYDAAWKRLYPTLAPVNFANVPTLGSGAAARRDRGRLAVFVKDPCSACEARVRALQAQGRAFDIYMVGLEDDAQVRIWATRVGIDPAKVRSREITLNHDDGRWLSVGGEGALPAVLADVHGQWQRE